MLILLVFVIVILVMFFTLLARELLTGVHSSWELRERKLCCAVDRHQLMICACVLKGHRCRLSRLHFSCLGRSPSRPRVISIAKPRNNFEYVLNYYLIMIITT